MLRFVTPLALLLLVAAPAQANTIHRCESRDGVLVFTDQACHQLGVAYSLDNAGGGGEVPVQRARPGMHRLGTPHGKMRYGIGCATRTPEAMLGAVRVAIESGDVNALAGLYDWNGASRGRAMGVVRRMQRLVRRDLLTVEFDYADYAPDFTMNPATFEVTAPAKPALPDLLVGHYAWGTGEATEGERFSLTRDNGCIWLAG